MKLNMTMNLIKCVLAFVMLTVLSACGGGGGNPGSPSGGSTAVALYTTAPASLSLTNGSTSQVYNITGGKLPYAASSDTPSLIGVSLNEAVFTLSAMTGKNGTGSVTITDYAGTKLSIAITVLAPTALFSTAPADLTLAIGASSVAYTVAGGTAPYTAVSTNPGIVSPLIPTGSGLLTIVALPGTSGGTASVIVSDAKGDKLTIAVTVSAAVALFVDAPANLTVSATAPGNTYTVSISGGTKPYTAVSSNPAVATASTPGADGRFVIQGVGAGNATVTVKDSSGTTQTVAVTVPAPLALFSNAPATMQILNGSTNFYSIYGGVAPYVVNTNGVIARAVISGSSLAITGLVVGHQTVGISDAKGAVISIDVTVNAGLYTDAPAALSLAANTGQTYAIYGGIPYAGTVSYRVNSSNPGVASATVFGSILSISAISTGATSLVITDSVGAAVSITVTVPIAGALMTTAPSPLTLATGTQGVYAISGGVAPYTATSSNAAMVTAVTSGVGGSSLTIKAVADTVGGQGNVVITDAVGTAPVTIAVTTVQVSFFTTAPATLAIASGDAKVFAVFGGTLPYKVVNTFPAIVEGVMSGSTLTISGKMAGSGKVILSDAMGVAIEIAVVVNPQGSQLVINAPASVFIPSGSSNTYDIIGGLPPYLASSGDLTVAQATIVNGNQVKVVAVGLGNTSFAVTDSAGTKVSIPVTTGTTPTPVAFFVSAPAALNMGAGTSATYQVGGGTLPYSASSSDGRVATVYSSYGSISITGLAIGKATLQISDAVGASKTISVTVDNGGAVPTPFFVAAPTPLTMGAGTTANYAVGGGSLPYSAFSSDGRVATASVSSAGVLTIKALAAGTATLLISDALGASKTISVTVDGSTGPSAAAFIDILASDNSLKSAPGSVISFIVTVKDATNAALPNQTVTFSATSGILTGASPAPVTNVAGTISTVTLSPGSDASIRPITVTVRTGTISNSITIPVVGTTLTVSGPGSIVVGNPGSFTAKAADSGGKPIVGAVLSISSAPNATGISPTTVTTDTSGAGTFTFTPALAATAGLNTLTVTGLGITGKAAVNVSNVDFSFVAPVVGASLNVGVAHPVTALYRVGGVGVAGQTINFATTRGTLSGTSAVTGDGIVPGTVLGQATVSVSSSTAGPVTVSAQTVTSSGTASTSQTAAFIATVPATVDLQANPSAVLPNAPGSTINQSALTAVVRDAVGNPIQGQVVNFTAVADASNGSIAPGSATTDAYGLAAVQFIAGPLSTATNGVQIQATLQSAPTITNTAYLTVNGSALFISIARSGVLADVGTTTYQKDFSVYVTDATGAPAGNRVVTLSVWPTTYGKGTLSWYLTPTPEHWGYSLGSPTICANEDRNQNGVLDLVPLPSEDTNGNGKLEPGSPAVITSLVTTDALGFASFTLRYGKNYAWWVSTRITAKSLVSGTESKQIHNYDLEMSSKDALSPSSPANVVSPFGSMSVCTDPN